MHHLNEKRKSLCDITFPTTNTPCEYKKQYRKQVEYMFPVVSSPLKCEAAVNIPKHMYLQNVHPLLAMYKHDLPSNTMSYSSFCDLLLLDKEPELLQFLTDLGLLNKTQQCVNCGGDMRKMKQGDHWFWICTRRANGKKCNNLKFSVRKGTFFGKSSLTIQCILRIIWNFVHHLNIEQCKQFCNLGTKTDHTVTEYYSDCRNVCNSWIWNPENTPKLGGYGKIIEMDESYFPGAPKFNRGRRLGTTWEDDEKWTFGMTERGNLDCILIQVPSSRTRKSLIPIINKHCLQGSLFCSDGWRAYHKLADHLDLEDVLHFPVNHSENYVDPNTGAHTQSIEGLWSHVKDFLPTRGMKPKDLGSYLGHFMWTRYAKQRGLDKFIHFLKSAADVRPPSHFSMLPNATMVTRPIRTEQKSDDDFL